MRYPAPSRRPRRHGAATRTPRLVMRGFFKNLRGRLFDKTLVFLKGPRYAIQRVLETPDRLKDCTLYLIGKPKPWSAALLCPCGCMETIHISLLENDSPSWSLHIGQRNKPSLEPSIWRKEGCRSHFYLSRGQIVWCRRR